MTSTAMRSQNLPCMRTNATVVIAPARPISVAMISSATASKSRASRPWAPRFGRRAAVQYICIGADCETNRPRATALCQRTAALGQSEVPFWQLEATLLSHPGYYPSAPGEQAPSQHLRPLQHIASTNAPAKTETFRLLRRTRPTEAVPTPSLGRRRYGAAYRGRYRPYVRPHDGDRRRSTSHRSRAIAAYWRRA